MTPLKQAIEKQKEVLERVYGEVKGENLKIVSAEIVALEIVLDELQKRKHSDPITDKLIAVDKSWYEQAIKMKQERLTQIEMIEKMKESFKENVKLKHNKRTQLYYSGKVVALDQVLALLTDDKEHKT